MARKVSIICCLCFDVVQRSVESTVRTKFNCLPVPLDDDALGQNKEIGKKHAFRGNSRQIVLASLGLR
jgi:hypothetical protein